MTAPAGGLELRWAARADVASYALTRANPDGSLEATVALGGDADRHLDSTVVPGLAYEWRMVATLTSGGRAYGVLRGGVDVALVEDRGRVLVCVAEGVVGGLAVEIERLRRDLAGDGWRPEVVTVPTGETVAGLKATIVASHGVDPLRAVFLLGDLPVPYSGSVYPDGHLNHRGAWPADVYYADVDGVWTDSWRHSTGASSPRNHNVVGDGKFDQSTLPSDADLMLGRVDLSDLPAFAPTSELELLRRYLDKDHAFRAGQLAVPRAALVDDNLPSYTEGFTANARSGFAAALGHAAVADGDWPAGTGSPRYLVGTGVSTASYTQLNGIGSTAGFAAGDPGVVFSLFFGSYFGDWDTADNLLRAPLACAGVALASGYCGRPQWQLHGLGLGEPLGEVARASQNARSLNPYHTSYYSRQIHVALHGDPTLRLFPRPAAAGVSLQRSPAGAGLGWVAPPPDGDLLGYHVYRSAGIGSPASRLNGGLLQGTAFLDPSPPDGGALYQVRAIYRETTGSGTFINNAQAAFASLAPLPVVGVGPATASLEEGVGAAVVTVTRSGALSAPLEVTFEFSGTASPVDDIVGADAAVTFPAGASSVEMPLVALADGVEEGAEEFVVALAGGGGGYLVGAQGVCVTIFDNAYSIFAQGWFGHDAADLGVAGEAADPDGDGVSNLLEFLAGSSPLQPSATPLEMLPEIEVDGVAYLRFRYVRVPPPSSLSVAVETSADLVTWSEPAGAILSTAPAPGGGEVVTVLVPKGGGVQRIFARLTVQSP